MSETLNNFEKIDSTLKEQINKEGWETGKDYNLKTKEENEGGMAVFVGTKEEAERAREIAETEGKAANLGAYIDMHKVIKVKSNEMELAGNITRETIFPGKAWLKDEGQGRFFRLLYIDRDSNIAEVEIKKEKIASFTGKQVVFSVIKQELEKERFDIEDVYSDESYLGDVYEWVCDQINRKQNKLNEEAKEKRKSGFNH